MIWKLAAELYSYLALPVRSVSRLFCTLSVDFSIFSCAEAMVAFSSNSPSACAPPPNKRPGSKQICVEKVVTKNKKNKKNEAGVLQESRTLCWRWQDITLNVNGSGGIVVRTKLLYSRWTSSLPPCLWLLRIFPSFPGSRLTSFYRDASSALLQLVNQSTEYDVVIYLFPRVVL